MYLPYSRPIGNKLVVQLKCFAVKQDKGIEPAQRLHQFYQYNINRMQLTCMGELMLQYGGVDGPAAVIIPVEENKMQKCVGRQFIIRQHKLCLVVGQNFA